MTLKNNIYPNVQNAQNVCALMDLKNYVVQSKSSSRIFGFLQEFYNPRRQKPSQSLGKCS